MPIRLTPIPTTCRAAMKSRNIMMGGCNTLPSQGLVSPLFSQGS